MANPVKDIASTACTTIQISSEARVAEDNGDKWSLDDPSHQDLGAAEHEDDEQSLDDAPDQELSELHGQEEHGSLPSAAAPPTNQHGRKTPGAVSAEPEKTRVSDCSLAGRKRDRPNSNCSSAILYSLSRAPSTASEASPTLQAQPKAPDSSLQMRKKQKLNTEMPDLSMEEEPTHQEKVDRLMEEMRTLSREQRKEALKEQLRM